MRKTLSKLMTPNAFLWLFILLGAALRLLRMWGPLTYDELSALCRLDYHSLSDLMEQAVRLADVHPGGVQLFLWLWCGLFGTAAWVVRLPFVAMGIACIPLLYAVAKRWFGPWPALLPAAVMALSQYAVYYSVMARPYVPGLLLMLCALYSWTRLLLQGDFRLRWLLLFAVSEALCAYTHYFALLSALLLALAGLLFVRRQQLLRYLAACLAAVLLFVPHLPITFYQLFEYKGIGGWLSTPTPSFLPDYLRYLLHHSLPVAAVALAAYLLSFSLQTLRRNWRLIVVALAVWLLPLLIGYLYSVTVNPLLQFSSLLFVFPFLLLALAGALDDAPRPHRAAILLAAFTLAMLLSLCLTRKHFSMMRSEWIETAAAEASSSAARYGADNVTYLFNVELSKLHYYDTAICSLPRSAMKELHKFDSLLATLPTDYLLCAGIREPKVLDVIASHYPYLLRSHCCVSTEVLLWSKQPAAERQTIKPLFSKTLALPTVEGEFFDLLDTTLGDLVGTRYCCLNAALTFRQPDSCRAPLRLVAETYVGHRRVDWREANAAQFCRRQGDTCTLNLPVRLETPVKHRSQLHRTRLKVYLWNPDGDTVATPLSSRIELFPSNPYIYSVLEEL